MGIMEDCILSDKDTSRIDRPSNEEIKMSTMSRAEKKAQSKASDKKGSLGDTWDKVKQHRKETAAKKAAEKRASEIDKASAAAEQKVAKMHDPKGGSKKKTKSKGKKKRGWKSWSKKKKFFVSILGIFMAILVVCGIYVAVVIAQAPKINPENIYAHVAQQSTLYDTFGNSLKNL